MPLILVIVNCLGPAWGLVGILGEGPFNFRDLGRRVIYFQGSWKQAIIFLFWWLWGGYAGVGSRDLRTK